MNLDELIRTSVQEVLAETKNEPGVPAQPAAPAPIVLNIQGKPVAFRDHADLEQQLNATAEAIARQNAALQAPQPEAKPMGARVTDDEGGPSFSNDEYIKLMNEDPRKATSYALSHMLFDGKVDNPAELIRETMISNATSQRQLAAYQFRDSHKDVPLEDPRVGNVVENIRKQLGLPFSADGLEAAYLYGVGKGQLPNFAALAAQKAQEQAQQAQQPQQYPYGQTNYFGPPQQQQTNPYLQGPPSPGRSAGGGSPFLVGDPEDMSAEQLGKILQKIQGGMG